MSNSLWYPCCDLCIFNQDDFERADNDNLGSDWNEYAGDADIVSNKVQLLLDDTVVINQIYDRIPQNDGQVIFGKTFYGNENGVQGRVIGGAVVGEATDRYWYAQYEWGTTNSELKLYLFEDGTGHTQYGTTVTIPNGLGSNVDLYLCLVPESNISNFGYATATALVGGINYSTASARTSLPTHEKAGFGCGKSPATAGNLTLDHWIGRRSSQDDDVSGCPDCPTPECSHCIDSEAPFQFEVEISGGDTTPACCLDVEGTYVLDRISPGQTPQNCICDFGSTACLWESAAYTGPCGTQTGCMSLSFRASGADTIMSLAFLIEDHAIAGAAGVRMEKTITGDVDCKNLNEEQLDTVVQHCKGFTFDCATGNLLAKVTAL